MKCRWCGLVFANYYADDGDICSDECADSETLAAEAMARLDARPTNPPKSQGFFRGPLGKPVTHEWDDDAGFICATGAEVTPEVIDELLGVKCATCPRCQGMGTLIERVSGGTVTKWTACPDCSKVGPGIRSGKVRE